MRRKDYEQVFETFQGYLQQQFFKGEKLMLNKVIITGRLVADPELRYTPSNKAVATARIRLST